MADAVSVSRSAAGVSASGLHRFAVTGVVAITVGLLTGAMQTSSGNESFNSLHQITAGAAAVLIVILALWMMREAALRSQGLAMLGLLLTEIATGPSAKDSPGVAIVHALCAPILLSMAMSAMVQTSKRWHEPPERVADGAWPSLSSLSWITLVMVVLQIALGAAFRHKEMSVLSHLFFAMVLVLVILCLCIFVMQQFPNHKALRPAANMLMAVAFTQVFLGIAAFTVRTMNKISPPVLIGVTALHVLVGAITLASATMMNLQIARNVYRKKADAE